MEDSRRTRRWLLGALGAVGVGAAVGRVPGADAATGDPMILGRDNAAGAETTLTGDLGVYGDGLFSRDSATTAPAVLVAYNGDNDAFYAQSDNGAGIRVLGYPALQVAGQLAGQFAGSFSIAAGAAKGSHALPYQDNSGPEFGATMVVATLQQHRAGVYVEAATITALTPITVTVFLNKPVSTATKIGYVVVN